MSHYSDHALPGSSSSARGQRDREPRRDSRLFGQIVPLSPPAQTLGAAQPASTYLAGPISSPIPPGVTIRRSLPTRPTTFPVTIPGLVTTPRTPENPTVFPRSPHPIRPRPIIVETGPILGPRFEQVPEDSPEEHSGSPILPASRHGSPPSPDPSDGGGGDEDDDGGNNDPPHPAGPSGPGPEGPPGPQGPPGPPGPPGGGGGGGGGGGDQGGPAGPARRAATLDPNERLFIQTLTSFRDAVDIWNRHTTAPRSTKSNLRNPDTFDGSDPAKLNLFLTQCYLHFAERTQDLPTDDDKILFMISYLWGTAQQWFAPNLYDPTAVPAWDGNFPVFVQELTMNFGPHDLVGTQKIASGSVA